MISIQNQFLPDSVYTKIVEHVPICTVDVLLFNEQKTETLLFKRLKKPIQGQYFSLGGRMFKNETFEQAAVRQMERELGIIIDANELHLSGVINEIFEDSAFEGVNYHTVNIFFKYICDKNIEFKLDNQHEEGIWFDVDDHSLHPIIQQKIRQCLFKF